MSGPEIKMTRTAVYLTSRILKSAIFIMTSSALFYMLWYWKNGVKGPCELLVEEIHGFFCHICC